MYASKGRESREEETLKRKDTQFNSESLENISSGNIKNQHVPVAMYCSEEVVFADGKLFHKTFSNQL